MNTFDGLIAHMYGVEIDPIQTFSDIVKNIPPVEGTVFIPHEATKPLGTTQYAGVYSDSTLGQQVSHIQNFLDEVGFKLLTVSGTKGFKIDLFASNIVEIFSNTPHRLNVDEENLDTLKDMLAAACSKGYLLMPKDAPVPERIPVDTVYSERLAKILTIDVGLASDIIKFASSVKLTQGESPWLSRVFNLSDIAFVLSTILIENNLIDIPVHLLPRPRTGNIKEDRAKKIFLIGEMCSEIFKANKIYLYSTTLTKLKTAAEFIPRSIKLFLQGES